MPTTVKVSNRGSKGSATTADDLLAAQAKKVAANATSYKDLGVVEEEQIAEGSSGLINTPKGSLGKAVDRADSALNTGWNGQLAIPVAGGLGGLLASKGVAWGPVFGAVPKALGYILGAPQHILESRVEDLAHLGSAGELRRAKAHMMSAQALHGKASRNLAKAIKPLEGGKLADVKSVLERAQKSHADVYEDAHAYAGDYSHAVRGEDGGVFSAQKAGRLDPRSIHSEFEAAAKKAEASGLSAKEIKALNKARDRMATFAKSTVDLQGHVASAEPMKARATTLRAEEDVRKAKFLSNAESKLGSVAGKAEEAVSRNGLLSKMRDWKMKSYLKAADRHGNNAVKIHGVAMKRLDTAISAIPANNSKFNALRKILDDTRTEFGNLPKDADAKTLKDIAEKFSDREKAFTSAAKALKKNGNLTAEEKTALGAIEKSFSGRFFGFFGVNKKLVAAHNPLEAQASSRASAEFAKDLRAGIKGLPEKFSKATGEHIFNGALYHGSQAITTIRTGQAVGTGFSEFKHMNADVTGNKNESFSTVKTSLRLLHLMPVAASMKPARAEFWESVGPRVLGNVAGMVAFSKVMGKGMSGKAQFLGMGLQIGSTMIGEHIASKHQLLAASEVFAEAEKTGETLPKEAYLGFLVQAHLLDKVAQNDPRVAIVAEQYAKEKASLATLMKEASSGAFAARLAAAKPEAAVPSKQEAPALKVTEADNQMLKSMGVAPEPVASEATKEPSGSALARLAGKGALAQDQIVGKYTGKEADRRLVPSPELSSVAS